jgi:hypothetical protein
MLRTDTVNPLNVFNKRRLNHCPPHFLPIYFDLRVNEKVITDWIYEHLSGRFYFDSQYQMQDKPIIQQCAAFENHQEASYFSLLLTDLNKSNYNP